MIFYNCSLGPITREFNTIEDTKEPATEVISVTCTGDNETGVSMASFKPGDAGYDDLFTAPTAPELESES